MTLEELREKLLKIKTAQERDWKACDQESDHYAADDLLLEYINDIRVTEIFNSIQKWYA